MFLIVDGVPNDDTQESARYRCLWLAVIHRAKLDVDGRDVDPAWARSGNLRKDAEDWLCGQGGEKWKKQLEMVCELAGVDPDKLIEVSRRRKYGMSDE